MSRYSSLPDGVPYSGNTYKDILAIKLDTSTTQMAPYKYNLLSIDADRFDSFVEYLYGDSELDYALLWLNGKSCSFELAINDEINIYDRLDMFRIVEFK